MNTGPEKNNNKNPEAEPSAGRVFDDVDAPSVFAEGASSSSQPDSVLNEEDHGVLKEPTSSILPVKGKKILETIKEKATPQLEKLSRSSISKDKNSSGSDTLDKPDKPQPVFGELASGASEFDLIKLPETAPDFSTSSLDTKGPEAPQTPETYPKTESAVSPAPSSTTETVEKKEETQAQSPSISSKRDAAILRKELTPKVSKGFDEAQLKEVSGEAVMDEGEEFYRRVLELLYEAKDLDISPEAKNKIREAMDSPRLPQLSVKDLVARKIVGKNQLARVVARSQNHREITSFLDVPQEAMEIIKDFDPKVNDFLREKRILPLWEDETDKGEKHLHFASDNSFRDLVVEAFLKEFMPKHTFHWHYALREVCGAFWLAGETGDVDTSMEAEALLDRVLGNAIDARCSDIHIDPSVKGEPRAVVKYRIDGYVTPKEVITLEQLERLKVRIENIARMPKVNQNHPNKGAFTRAGYDWRVQVQPHAGRQGPVPRMVLRRLQPDVIPMEALGYPQYFIEDIKIAAGGPNGVIFWTGPTGSGKTESIHSAVVSVNPMGRGLSVHTIEDPPEKRVSGYAVQMEMTEMDPARSGLELLKSSLRADPDVVIFGEVRDEEMASLVFEAANTGHLVFSTLHTNTSLDAVVRLDELGIFGFLMSYVRGIAAQRLVRRLCTHCRIKVDQMDDFTASIFERYEVDTEDLQLYNANPDGCPSCGFKGYHGRIAICEWLKPSKELVEASTEREYDGLEEIARRAGWKPMGYMGALHIKNGITDSEELASKVLELSSEAM